MSLPEAATAALAQWNACSSAVLSALRSLPEPTKEQIIDTFNEEDTTNLFYAYMQQPPVRLLGAGDDDPNHPWGTDLGAPDLADQSKWEGLTLEAIVNPNSSGQGYDEDHKSNPHHATLLKHSYAYSHTTPVRNMDGERTMHHTYKKGDHNVSVYKRSHGVGAAGNTHVWSASKSGSGYHYAGRTDAELNKYLQGRAKRHEDDQSGRGVSEIEESAAHDSVLTHHGWKRDTGPEGQFPHARYTHPNHPGHVIRTYLDKSWTHVPGKTYGGDAEHLAAHLSNFHGTRECYESTLPTTLVDKHRIVIEYLCPGLAQESAFATFQENPKQYFVGHGWSYVTDTPNGSMFRHPRFHGNDIIINHKSGQWEHIARGNRVATGQSFDDFRKYAAPRFQMRMESVVENGEKDIVADHGTHWVHHDKKKNRYTVYSTGVTHSTSDSSYPATPDGLSIATARSKYLASKSGGMNAHLRKYKPESVNEAEGDFSRIARSHGYKRTQSAAPHGTGKIHGKTYANWSHPTGYKLHHHGENWHSFAPGHDDPKNLSVPGRTHLAGPIATGKGTASMAAHLSSIHGKKESMGENEPPHDWFELHDYIAQHHPEVHKATKYLHMHTQSQVWRKVYNSHKKPGDKEVSDFSKDESVDEDITEGEAQDVLNSKGWLRIQNSGPHFHHPKHSSHKITVKGTGKKFDWEHTAREHGAKHTLAFGGDIRTLRSHLHLLHKKKEDMDEGVLPDASMLHVLSRHGYQHHKATKNALVYKHEGGHSIHVWNTGAGGWLYQSGSNIKHGAGAQTLMDHLDKVHGSRLTVKESVNEWGDGSRPGDSPVMASIRNGHRVTIKNRFGQHSTGRAVMRGPAGWVLNMGGKHGTPAIAHDDNIVKVHAPKAKKEDVNEDWQWTKPIIYEPSKTNIFRGQVDPPRPSLENVEVAYGTILSELMVLISTVPSQYEAATLKLLYTELSQVKQAISLLRSENSASDGAAFMSILASVRAAVGDGDDVYLRSRFLLHGESVNEINAGSNHHTVLRTHGWDVRGRDEENVSYIHDKHPSHTIKVGNEGFWKHLHNNTAIQSGHAAFALDRHLKKFHSVKEDITELPTNNPDYQGWPEIDKTDTPDGAKVVGDDATEMGAAILTGFESVDEEREMLLYGLPKDAHPTERHKEVLLHTKGTPNTIAKVKQLATGDGFHSFRVAHFDSSVPPDFTQTLNKRKREKKTEGVGNCPTCKQPFPQCKCIGNKGITTHKQELMTNCPDYRDWFTIDHTAIPDGAKVLGHWDGWRVDEDLTVHIRKMGDGFAGISPFTGKNMTGVLPTHEQALARLRKIVDIKCRRSESAGPSTRRLLHRPLGGGPSVTNEGYSTEFISKHGYHPNGVDDNGGDIQQHHYAHPAGHRLTIDYSKKAHQPTQWKHTSKKGDTASGYTANHLNTYLSQKHESSPAPVDPDTPTDIPPPPNPDTTIPTEPTPPPGAPTENFHYEDQGGDTDPGVDPNDSPKPKKPAAPKTTKEFVEMSPPGFSGTVKKMKEKGMAATKAFALAWSMYKKGYKPHVAPEGFQNKNRGMHCTEARCKFRTYSASEADKHRRSTHLHQQEFINENDLDFLKSFQHNLESLSNATHITTLECHGYVPIAQSRPLGENSDDVNYYFFKHSTRPKDYVRLESRLAPELVENAPNGYSWTHFPGKLTGSANGRSLSDLNTHFLALSSPSDASRASGRAIQPPSPSQPLKTADEGVPGMWDQTNKEPKGKIPGMWDKKSKISKKGDALWKLLGSLHGNSGKYALEASEPMDEMSPYRFTNATEILSQHGFNQIKAPRISASVYKNDQGHHVVVNPHNGAWMHLMGSKGPGHKTSGSKLPHLDTHLAREYGSAKFVESVGGHVE